jgi:hypothetical protein
MAQGCRTPAVSLLDQDAMLQGHFGLTGGTGVQQHAVVCIMHDAGGALTTSHFKHSLMRASVYAGHSTCCGMPISHAGQALLLAATGYALIFYQAHPQHACRRVLMELQPPAGSTRHGADQHAS